MALSFFLAMFRADDVLKTLNCALIDMQEIQLSDDNEVILSEFSEKMYKSIASIKLKRIFEMYKRDENKNIGSSSEEIRVRRSNITLDKITLNNLSQEMAIIFKNTDKIDVIIQSLINIDCIDSNGICSEKANLLLNTIISNKIIKSLSKSTDENLEMLKENRYDTRIRKS